MVTLRDIMTREVFSIAPGLSIRDAMSLLSTRHISGAPVMAGGEVIGVVTATDLMAFAADLPGVPVELPDYVEPGEWKVREGIEEDGRELEPPATFFTELWDDAGADTALRFSAASGPEWSALDEHTVEEAMTRAPICKLPADTTLAAAAEFMRVHSVHRVLVIDRGRLVGIATTTDLANAIADHKLREREYVFGKGIESGPVVRGKRAHPESTLGDRLPGRSPPKES